MKNEDPTSVSLATNLEMVFPADDWTMASPESQGVDADKLDAAVAYLQANAGNDGVRELVIVRNGSVIRHGDNIDKQHGVWSVTKSFTSTVLGLLIDDGKATLDTKAMEAVPDLAADYPAVTLRHFTTMTSGYQAQGDQPPGHYSHGQTQTPFRPAEPLFEPGSKYAYWDSAMNTLALVLTRIVGQPLEDVFRQRIADPIGMNPDQWDWGNCGKVEIEGGRELVVNCGSGNMGQHVRISARELARLGHLFLNHGRWKDQQLISDHWVEAATQTQVPASVPLGSPRCSDIHGPGLYGYNWWTNGIGADGKRKWPGAPTAAYAAVGANNNHMFVLPPWNMVVVRLGMDVKDRKITDEVYGEFLSKLDDAISSETKM